MSGAPICRVLTKEHQRGREAETMPSPNPDKEPPVKTVILSKARRLRQRRSAGRQEREAKVGARVWMWWTDGSRSEYGRVGAVAVCKHRDRWKAYRSPLGTRGMNINYAELWAIGLTLRESVKKRETLQPRAVTKVAVFSHSQAAIRRTQHPELGRGQPLARWITGRARTLREAGIQSDISWVPGHTGNPANEEADRHAHLVREGRRSGTV